MHVPDPQVPTPARQMSPTEREDSTQKRQTTAEVHTVLTIAGGLQRKRDGILDRRPKSITRCKTEKYSQHGHVWCGRSGRMDAISDTTVGIRVTLDKLDDDREQANTNSCSLTSAEPTSIRHQEDECLWSRFQTKRGQVGMVCYSRSCTAKRSSWTH